MSAPRDRLAFPLDYATLDAARRGAALVSESVGVLKVGLELFVREGPAAARIGKEFGCEVFLDLKLHDIPETVERAVASACSFGVRYLTLHASGGPKMLERAVRRAESEDGRLVLLAVTVLTSLDASDLEVVGFPADPAGQALRLGRLARASGIPGLVCSAAEVASLRSELGPSMTLVTPGIRPAGGEAGDQKRIATPASAIRAGSSLLVVGRPIRDDPDPRAAARRIVDEIAQQNERRAPRRNAPERAFAPDGRLIVGLRPVREAVRRRHGAALREVLIEDRPTPALEALARFATDQRVALVRRSPRAELDRVARGVSHQGAAAFAPDLELVPLETLLDDPELVALALDSLTDPQNFGAVVRSAVAFGGAAVLWGEHASAPLTPATFRASAGAIEHARLCRVHSLVQALGALGERGVHVVGLDPDAKAPLAALDLSGPVLLVLGSEGEGLGRACRSLASLGTLSVLQSVNVSVAAGIALYEIRNQRIKSNT